MRPWPPPSPKLSSILSGSRGLQPTGARDLPLPTPFERPSFSVTEGAWPAPGPHQADLTHSGEVISKIGDLLFGDRLHHVGHAAVIAVAAVILVFGKRLGEVVLALIGDPRDVLLAGKIGVMTAIATVLLRQCLTARHARGIAGTVRRRRLRQFSDEIGKGFQVVVGQRCCHRVHRLKNPQLFAEHEKLDQRVRRLLATERGGVLSYGLPAFAMAGKTRCGALFDGFGARRKGDGGKRQRRNYFT